MEICCLSLLRVMYGVDQKKPHEKAKISNTGDHADFLFETYTFFWTNCIIMEIVEFALHF
jgi:hypothetical protein